MGENHSNFEALGRWQTFVRNHFYERETGRKLEILILSFFILLVFFIFLKSIFTLSNLYLFTEKTTGTVFSSSIQETREFVDEERGTNVVFHPVVEFTYILNGVERKGTRLQPVLEKGDRVWATTLSQKFKKGDTVEVYYFPKNPEISFITRSMSSSFWANFWGSLLTLPILLSLIHERIKKIPAELPEKK